MKTHYYTKNIIEICDTKHLSVDEIFLEIQKKFPDAGKSSIYRNVEQLAASGDLTKVSGLPGNEKKVLFEKTKAPHAHFVCKNSGEILDIEVDTEIFQDIQVTHPLTQKKISLAEFSGHKSVVDITIHGVLNVG